MYHGPILTVEEIEKQVINYKIVQVASQSAITDLTVETVEQDVKSKLTIKTPE